MPFRVLAFDTSTPFVCLCLMADGQVVLEKKIEPRGALRQEATTMLMPSVAAAVAEVGWSKLDISCLVVGQGPGSFTGIRCGVVTARMLAQALTLPLVGVCSLECFARQGPLPAAVILSGAPGYFFAGAYDARLDQPLLAPGYFSAGELEAKLHSVKRWLADDQAMAACAKTDHLLEPLPVINNLATSQAQIAWNRLSLRLPAGPGRLEAARAQLAEMYDWRNVEPLYLRAPSVTLKKGHGHQSEAHDAVRP